MTRVNELTNVVATVLPSPFRTLAGAGTAVNGVYPAGSAHADYDNDGDLDVALVVGGDVVLMRNDGHGEFTEVSGAFAAGSGFATHLAWGDHNSDGWIDLAVARSAAASDGTTNQLFTSVGNGSFTDTSALLASGGTQRSRTIGWADWDNECAAPLAHCTCPPGPRVPRSRPVPRACRARAAPPLLSQQRRCALQWRPRPGSGQRGRRSTPPERWRLVHIDHTLWQGHGSDDYRPRMAGR
jgi:hypothetical protein